MSTLQNKTALITGGASGIGKLMGELLLQKGLKRLVIWDINATNLASTLEAFTKKGYTVAAYCVDLAQTISVQTAAEKVKIEIGKIDILINNAGIIVGKSFQQHSQADIESTMRINTIALMQVTNLFLADMVTAKQGHIINIASAAGMTSNPNMSVYVASKWAVIGWSDSLYLEMKNNKTSVQVTTVTPYYINTGMFDGVKSRVIPILEPMLAAKKIIHGIEKNKRFVRMPGIVYLLYFIKGLLPASWFDQVVGKWMGVYHSMDQFKGRAQ
jgi:short-subunit dehydrogenase